MGGYYILHKKVLSFVLIARLNFGGYIKKLSNKFPSAFIHHLWTTQNGLTLGHSLQDLLMNFASFEYKALIIQDQEGRDRVHKIDILVGHSAKLLLKIIYK